MKKFLLVSVAIFMSITMAFADVDIWNIPDVITGVNSVKFTPERVELIAGTEMIKVGASLLNVKAIFNTGADVIERKDYNEPGANIKQGFNFMSRGFVSVVGNFSSVSVGLGYQYDVTRGVIESSSTGLVEGVVPHLEKKLAMSHGIGVGLAFLEKKLLFNIPIFIGAADKKAYGVDSKFPMIIGLKPWAKYVFGGQVMDYLKLTIDYGMIGKAAENKSASSFGVIFGAGFTFATDPVKMYSEPEVSFYMGMDSSKIVDASSAGTVNDWHSFYNKDKNKNLMLFAINFPVEFSAMIADSVKAYGKPSIAIGYKTGAINIEKKNGDTDVRSAFGIGYGLVVGLTFTPVENLEVNLEGVGGTVDNYQYLSDPTKFGGNLSGYVTYKF